MTPRGQEDPRRSGPCPRCFSDDPNPTHRAPGALLRLSDRLTRNGFASTAPHPAQTGWPQNGFANTNHTTAINANSGNSLNQRSAVGEGSGFPFATLFSQRPATM